MSLMEVYIRLLLFVLYVTDEGLAKIITVRGVWEYVTDDGLLKIITVHHVCHC
jgi:hypothetical protein